MRTKLVVLLSLYALWFGDFAAAADSADLEQLQFPGQPHTQIAADAQAAADKLYAQQRFEDALLVYRDVLVSTGDKYAQYMVGYLHQRGEGVATDPIEAYAWYRLAAQRGEAAFLEALIQHRTQLTAAQIETGEQHYEELNKSLGDQAILRNLIRSDQACIRTSTGSRTGGARVVRVIGNDCNGKSRSEAKALIRKRQSYLKQYQEFGSPP